LTTDTADHAAEVYGAVHGWKKGLNAKL